MSRKPGSTFTRRQLLQAGAMAGTGLALGGRLHAAGERAAPLITKAIPAGGERLPALGIGTNAFRESNYADVKAILQRIFKLSQRDEFRGKIVVLEDYDINLGRHLVQGRQIAMYLCRELTALSLPKIGAQFGNRDHTTVMYAVQKVADQMAGEGEVLTAVQALTGRLTGKRERS